MRCRDVWMTGVLRKVRRKTRRGVREASRLAQDRSCFLREGGRWLLHCNVPYWTERRINWRSESRCSKIELGTTSAGVNTPGYAPAPMLAVEDTIS